MEQLLRCIFCIFEYFKKFVSMESHSDTLPIWLQRFSPLHPRACIKTCTMKLSKVTFSKWYRMIQHDWRFRVRTSWPLPRFLFKATQKISYINRNQRERPEIHKTTSCPPGHLCSSLWGVFKDVFRGAAAKLGTGRRLLDLGPNRWVFP